ncbi:MAG: hypothetical protein QM500_12175 [Methylococcales bacterium]
MLFNFVIGVLGLLLAGDSIGRGARSRDIKIMAIGVTEVIIGLYFAIAAIGSVI